MPKEEATHEAIRRAVEDLRCVDIGQRCRTLGLPRPAGGVVRFRAFGVDMTLDTRSWTFARGEGGGVKAADQVLLLHYLQCDLPLRATGDLMSFREFPGGQFYLAPFKARTTEPLVRRFRDDVATLRAHLDRFDWEPVSRADLGARIHCLGELSITLHYYLSDGEFPASAEVLFDGVARRVLCAEDAAVMASRICIGLL